MKRKHVTHCIDCGAAKPPGLHGSRQRCGPCGEHFYRQISEAQRVLYKAIRDGVLTKARGLTCVDCGGVATDWEHRDYSKPLEVEPTCRSCNFKRGPAAYAKRPELEAA